jgi:phenylacetate-CoA ligase
MVKGLFWNEKIEAASISELRRLQTKLLKIQLKKAYENSRFYRKKFKAQGIHPSEIRHLKDIHRLPFTTREELEKNFDDILSIPMSRVATIRQTSGTTGNPLTIAHSRKDVDMVADAYARKLVHHGVTSKDVVQVTSTYGLWQGAWSVHSGAEKIGACMELLITILELLRLRGSWERIYRILV